MRYHAEHHLPARLAKAHAAAEAAEADDLLAQVRDQRARALHIYDSAEREGSFVAAIVALREARGCLELLGELLHELDRRPTVNLTLSAGGASLPRGGGSAASFAAPTPPPAPAGPPRASAGGPPGRHGRASAGPASGEGVIMTPAGPSRASASG